MAGTETNAIPVAAVPKKNVGKKRGPYKPRQKKNNSDVDTRDRSNIGADPSRGGSRGYDVHFRRRALELAEVVGIDEAALQLGVSVGSMYRWRRRIIPYKMTGGRKKKENSDENGDGTGAASSSSAAATTTEDEEDDAGDDDNHQESYEDAAAPYSNDSDYQEMQMTVDGGNSSGQPTQEEEDDDMLQLLGGQRDSSADPNNAAAAAAAAASGTSGEMTSRAAGEGMSDGTEANTDVDAASPLLMLNTNGGSYRQGSAFSYEKKKEVAALYRELLKREGGGEGAPPLAVAAATNRVTHRMLAAEAKVSKGYAQKVMEEIREHGDVLRPAVMGRRKTGPGSKAFTHFDQVVLMQLHAENPYRRLESYKQELFLRTGTHASESVVSRWLQSMFPNETRVAGHGGGGGGAHKRPPPQQDEATLSLMSPSSSSSTASPRKRSAVVAAAATGCAASVAPSLLHPSFEALLSDETVGDQNGGGSSSTAYPATSAQEGSESTATSTTATSAQQQQAPGSVLEAAAYAGGATATEVGAVAVARPPAPARKPAFKRARAAAGPKPAPLQAATAEQLRTQLEARLLEAAYFVRPLLTAASLTSRSPGHHECFPKRHVRNAYEYLLQHPDDANRFVVSFEKSGIGQALVQAAAVGVEGAEASTASPYGMLVDLCAAGYVNRIVSCGKQAAITSSNAAAAAVALPRTKAPGQGGIPAAPAVNGSTISQPKPPPPPKPAPLGRPQQPQPDSRTLQESNNTV